MLRHQCPLRVTAILDPITHTVGARKEVMSKVTGRKGIKWTKLTHPFPRPWLLAKVMDRH